jgi:hypothetical protein
MGMGGIDSIWITTVDPQLGCDRKVVQLGPTTPLGHELKLGGGGNSARQASNCATVA